MIKEKASLELHLERQSAGYNLTQVSKEVPEQRIHFVKAGGQGRTVRSLPWWEQCVDGDGNGRLSRKQDVINEAGLTAKQDLQYFW